MRTIKIGALAVVWTTAPASFAQPSAVPAEGAAAAHAEEPSDSEAPAAPQASQESGTKPAGAQTTTAAPGRSTASRPGDASDASLMAELQAASAQDNAGLRASRGEAGIHAEQRDEDPANLVLGKEVVGNETNPSISLLLDTAFAYFEQNDRIRWGGHAPQRAGPSIQEAELAIAA
ncbi:MAG: hypothetical protein MUF54_13120, partial [Polyangiaceae bacterium]|nr:hypothetical protein [Polyangiaceae bacterium]